MQPLKNKLLKQFQELRKFYLNYLFLQKYGVKIIITVNNSSLPRSIKKQDHHLAKKGSSEKVFIGPNEPIEGPTFPKLEAETPNADTKSKPKIAKTIVPKMKDKI